MEKETNKHTYEELLAIRRAKNLELDTISDNILCEKKRDKLFKESLLYGITGAILIALPSLFNTAPHTCFP